MAEEVSISPTTVGLVLHWMDDLETKARAIINDIPSLEDEQLHLIHDQAASLGHWSWKIQAAARKEILYRAEKKVGGRGRKDITEEGRKAVAKKLAHQLGVHPRTIMEDAAIASTFFPETSGGSTTSLEQQASYEHLTEKDYFRAALRADDPHEAIEYFAERKAENPTYSTTDAWNYIKSQKTPTLDSNVPPLIEDEEAKAWYGRFIEILEEAPPSPDLRRILMGCIEEVRHVMQRPTTTRRAQLLELIRDGVDELDQIAQEIGVDRVNVGVWINRLIDDGTLADFQKEARPGARGQRRTGHRIIGDE